MIDVWIHFAWKFVDMVEGVSVESMVCVVFPSRPEAELGMPSLTVKPKCLNQHPICIRYFYLSGRRFLPSRGH